MPDFEVTIHRTDVFKYTIHADDVHDAHQIALERNSSFAVGDPGWQRTHRVTATSHSDAGVREPRKDPV